MPTRAWAWHPNRNKLALAFIGILIGMSGAASAATKPNVILVLTDDQGWADTSVQMMDGVPESKSSVYRTPALERMAAAGMVFSNAYSAAPTCTPSRGGIQFGKTPARLRQTVVHDVLAKVRGIDCRDEVSLAQMIRAADGDYITAHFGKWGFPPRKPEDAGYHQSDGNTNNGDGDYASVKDRTPLPADDPKRIFSLTRRANAFIERQAAADRPFFMQVSHYALHVQHAARPETVAKYGSLPHAAMRQYAAMIEDLDAGLGMLLDKLQELGIGENTYVIFTSDNGGGFRSNGPLRGGKAELSEGGIRVPTVICGPDVKAGVHCDIPIAAWDFFPTIADLIGSRRPLPEGIDGGSLRPLLEHGNAGKVARGTQPLIFHFPWYDNLPTSAIRLGDYKLIENLNTGQTRLFDLDDDIGETQDLSAAMPERARRMHTMLRDYLRAVDAETVGAMRSARREELLSYAARTQAEISELQQLLKQPANDAQKRQLQDQLTERKRRLKAHQDAMARLQRAERLTDW